MAGNRRVDLKAILADPDLRRELMVSTIQATQAREGIQTTEDQADRAYYVVSEGEKAAFFDLEGFRGGKGQSDRRHETFVRALLGSIERLRFDVPRRDFDSIAGSPLAYHSVGLVSHIFREALPLEPKWGIARQGKATANDARWLRQWWEVEGRREWVPFAKGGSFSRFYYDVDLTLNWKEEDRDKLKTTGNGLPNIGHYFKPGLGLRLNRRLALGVPPCWSGFTHLSRGSSS